MQPNAWKNFKYLLCCRVPPRPRTSSAKDIDPNSGFLAEKNNNFFARDKFISQADYDHHFIVNQINQNPFGTFANSVHSFFYPSNSLHSEPRDSSMIEFTPSFERAMGGAGGGLSRQNTNTGGTFSRKNTENSKQLQRTTTNTTTATGIMNKGGTSPNVNKNNSKSMKSNKPSEAINYVDNPIRSNSPLPNNTNNDNNTNTNNINNNNTADTSPRTIEAESRPEADSISSAYDFFDEDFRNVGGAYSNSFAQRRSSWGMRGESLGSEITSEVGSLHSTLHTSSMTRTTRSAQEIPDMESTYDQSDAESRA
jgi:hypothetical protein